MQPQNVVVEEDNSIKFGKILANPPPGEEVVISGLSGRYPESHNVYEFRDNLFNKNDMVSGDNRRWKPGHPEIPQRTGKVPDVRQFDAGFFGFHFREATQMCPMTRIFLQVAIEAIFDAGLNPQDLEGTNTGVFVGACFNESERTWFSDKLVPQGFAILGNIRSMIANNVSKFLKLKGPSFISDTACSSSLFALENAYKAIRMGSCDRAIVGGGNLCLHPYVSLQFARLGVLSPDGACKAFDKAGNGYARSEAISAIILQKSNEAKRIYATILHAKTNCDGYKNSGITYPSGEMQIKLLKEFYQECDYIKPSEISFLEAHGTGTKVGDPEELNALDKVFAIDRATPILIGSVKSNIGHTEPTSGLCSITKAIIANETGYIPPNMHYKTPRPGVKGLETGRLKVVDHKMPFPDNRGLIGINSFGFGGGNCHVLLKRHLKIKRDVAADNIPRLIFVSGRTQDAVNTLLDDVINNGVDIEHIRLIHEIFRKNINGHLYRGYSLVSKSGEIIRSSKIFKHATSKHLVVCFGEIDHEINKHAKEFLEFPVAANTIQKVHEVLDQKQINILNIFRTSKYSSIQDIILANFTLQIIFADLIKTCNILPDKIFGISKGLSLGALVCAYFDEALTLDEATECAYSIACSAQAISENKINCCDDLCLLINQDSNAAKNLKQILNKKLKKSKIMGKTAISNGKPQEISIIYLISCYGESSKIVENAKKSFKKSWTMFEVGNGKIAQVLTKELFANKFINIQGGLNTVLSSFGKLYESGFNPQIQNLYPKIEFPVSRCTPMISPSIKWQQERELFITSFENTTVDIEEKSFSLMSTDPEWMYLKGHVIDGRNLVPATEYLKLVWETLAYIHRVMIEDMKVVFENCKFKRSTTLPKGDKKIRFSVMIQRGTGNFEVIESGEPVVSGRIYYVPEDNNQVLLIDLPKPSGVNNKQSPYMNKKDVYKELRLRGYNYSGPFKAINSCDISAQVANIQWDGNWVTFIDNMLQMKILQQDTRFLYVPVGIQKLIINAKEHKKYINEITKENPTIPAYSCLHAGLIRSGGIEIRGLNANSIGKRKYQGIPVLEKYVFVPNETSLSIEKALRVNMQIILENLPSIKVKVVELVDEATDVNLKPLAEIICDVLADIPLIHPDITILSDAQYDLKNVKVENKKLLTEVECSLVTGSKILQRIGVLQLAFGSVKENGFLLSREPLNFDTNTLNAKGISVITVFTTPEEKLVLFRKKINMSVYSVVPVKDPEFTWMTKLQDTMAKNENVLLCSQGEPINGSLGLVTCIRREPGGQNVRLLYTTGSVADFNPNLPFYKNQLNKNLVINVYKDGQWGTYRHLLLEAPNQTEAEHCYLNSLRKGDLSSFAWIEGPLKINNKLDPEQTLVYVHYAAINFKDVMTASGKISVDFTTTNRREQESNLNFEFSGITASGDRVMGIISNGACASIITADTSLLWKVPDNWSLQEAVTVPVVYSTSILGLVERGKMKKGESILIHSGTGGVGLAAIQISLHMGCIVYTTVGTPEKKAYLKKKFPQIKENQILNSRTTEFEKQIMKLTKGRGVDLVLNSLSGDKLQASIRCLAYGGRFIEIGKFDLAGDNTLNLILLEKGASFHGVMLDVIMNESHYTKMQIYKTIQHIIDSKAIIPLPKTIFKMHEAEAAFRYMTTGKHIGKVIMQIREETNVFHPQINFPCLPRYHCDPDKVYIICGGLGGFGLELADWLILRGCKHLVLTSRTGIKTGYQGYRIRIWKSYGCEIKVTTDDISTYKGCLNLIKSAKNLAPIQAIFNLAVVLKDAIFINQKKETFKTSFGPKAYATAHLDDISRKLCPDLRDFVVFSSVSCGRGNAGQTNYGMANSVMEKICEKRKNDGLPALAIEWGAIGDVGLIADMQEEAIEMEIGGTLQQRISNCLEVMDQLLKQNDAAIVSSIVVAEKKSRMGGSDNIVDVVAAILGVKDLKSISLQATLAEVGMDSMTAVEIKQTLEREHDVFLTSQDIKGMTFGKLIEIQAEMDVEKQEGVKKERALTGMDMIVRIFPDEKIANTIVMPIKNLKTESNETVIVFPGIEGTIQVMEPFCKNIRANVVGLQYTNSLQTDTIEEMAEIFLPIIEQKITKNVPFKIICYSFGGSVALETVKLLEQKGYHGKLICIDGAPNYLKALTKILDVETDNKLQVSVIVHLVTLQHPYEVMGKHVESLLKCDTLEAKLKLVQSLVPSVTVYSAEHERNSTISLYKRLKSIVKWTPNFKLKSKVILFKPSLVSIKTPDEIPGLASLCEDVVDIKTFDGNHVTILDNPKLVLAVNEVFDLMNN